MDFNHIFTSLIVILNEMSPYILLGFLIAGVLHVFVPANTMSSYLSGKGMKPVVLAALFGIPLPLCSCGVLPTAVALRRQGASKGASTSFLIATPQTGVDSIAATWSLLGLPFAIIRPVAALAGAILGGAAVSKYGGETSGCGNGCLSSLEESASSMTFGAKVIESIRYGLVDMVASVGKWLVIGLVLAALITALVPESLFLGLSSHPFMAMLVMIIVAIPMYICATGSIPIALSLMLKGLSPGVAFVLLMAGPAANFASVMILSRTMGRRTTAIYVASVVTTALAFGLAIDYLMPSSWFVPNVGEMTATCHVEYELFPTICSVVLLGLLGYSAIRGRGMHHHEISETNQNITSMKKKYIVKGMSCPHCQATVTKVLSALPGAEAVSVDLGTSTAVVEGEVDPEEVKKAIYNAGFTVG